MNMDLLCASLRNQLEDIYTPPQIAVRRHGEISKIVKPKKRRFLAEQKWAGDHFYLATRPRGPADSAVIIQLQWHVATRDSAHTTCN
jgi:hypothetical protein